MSEIYEFIRVVNFIWAFVLFIGMLYFGLLDVTLSRACGHEQVPPEFKLWAFSSFLGCAIIAWSTGEVLVLEIKGGPRSFLPIPYLAIVSWTMYLGAVRVLSHRYSIRAGKCGAHE